MNYFLITTKNEIYWMIEKNMLIALIRRKYYLNKSIKKIFIY